MDLATDETVLGDFNDTVFERYDEGPLYIRKRRGGREQFDRAKVLAGLERAAIKRPVEREQLEAVVDRIVAEPMGGAHCHPAAAAASAADDAA